MRTIKPAFVWTLIFTLAVAVVHALPALATMAVTK
jgi:hypothetical protein